MGRAELQIGRRIMLYKIGVVVEIWVTRVFVCTTLIAGSLSAALLESCADIGAQGDIPEFSLAQESPAHCRVTEVSDPVRGGETAFRHWLDQQGQRSELAMTKTQINGVYWYGWSMLIPGDFDYHGSDTTAMRLATRPSAKTDESSVGIRGSYMQICSDGRLVFHLQHPDGHGTATCAEFTLAQDVASLKGKWLDFVMHTKWTGDNNGFFKLWMKFHDNNYLHRVNYQGATWWPETPHGPCLKMGLYMDQAGWNGPPSRTLYTDEYRLGDGASSFNDVASPGADARLQAAKSGRLQYRSYYSALNQQDIPIMVYTPPGYEASAKRYPVVYNLHGAGGGSPERQWRRIQATLVDAMEKHGSCPVIYVFANGLGDSFFIDAQDGSIKPGSSIVQELIPFVDAGYRTIPTQQGRAIDGFSMGGCACLMLAFKHPELFSSVVSYAGAVIPHMIAEYSPIGRFHTREHYQAHSPWTWARKNADMIRSTLRVRMICGDQDRVYPANRQFVQLLNKLNIPVDWVVIPDVAHDTGQLYRRFGLESLAFMARDFTGRAKD